MASVTNNTKASMDFVVKGEAKNGVPPTGSVGAGETKNLDIDLASSVVRGRIAAGAITVATPKVQAAPAAKPKD